MTREWVGGAEGGRERGLERGRKVKEEWKGKRRYEKWKKEGNVVKR